MKALILAVGIVVSNAAIAAPITLVCTEIDEQKVTDNTLRMYVDIDEREMLVAENKDNWIELKEVKINKVSVSGKAMLSETGDIYVYYDINRVDMHLKKHMRLLGEFEELNDANCKIEEFEIETQF